MNPPKLEGGMTRQSSVEGGGSKSSDLRTRTMFLSFPDLQMPEHQEACEGWFMLEHQNVLNCLFLYLFSATMPEEKIVDTKKSHNS
ncbi:unnamed protein product [Brassica oleracea]